VAGSAEYLQALLPLQTWVTIAAVGLISAQLIFLVNLFWSMRRGALAPPNPWQSTTLEWQTFAEGSVVHHGPYEYRADGFVVQSEPIEPQRAQCPTEEVGAQGTKEEQGI
jgi:heme/copper-type cytochrome/quinol oxidase subunit 1